MMMMLTLNLLIKYSLVYCVIASLVCCSWALTFSLVFNQRASIGMHLLIPLYRRHIFFLDVQKRFRCCFIYVFHKWSTFFLVSFFGWISLSQLIILFNNFQIQKDANQAIDAVRLQEIREKKIDHLSPAPVMYKNSRFVRLLIRVNFLKTKLISSKPDELMKLHITKKNQKKNIKKESIPKNTHMQFAFFWIRITRKLNSEPIFEIQITNN